MHTSSPCFPRDAHLVLHAISRKTDGIGNYYEFGIDGRETPAAPCSSRQDFFEPDRVKGCLDYLAARMVHIPAIVTYCDSTKTPVEIKRLRTKDLEFV